MQLCVIRFAAFDRQYVLPAASVELCPCFQSFLCFSGPLRAVLLFACHSHAQGHVLHQQQLWIPGQFLASAFMEIIVFADTAEYDLSRQPTDHFMVAQPGGNNLKYHKTHKQAKESTYFIGAAVSGRT